MKRESKSAPKCTGAILLGIFFFLTGCADTQLPSWLTGEPDPSVLAAPRAVQKAKAPDEKTWPNLADVPTNKPFFSNPEDRRQKAEELMSDRLKAEADMERIRNIRLEKDGLDPSYELSDENLEPTVEPMKPFSALRP